VRPFPLAIRAGADVALQVDAAGSGPVAQQREVEADHVADVLRLVGEALHPVVGEAACAGARSSQLVRFTGWYSSIGAVCPGSGPCRSPHESILSASGVAKTAWLRSGK
jgi:hypothetical protein